MFTVINCHHCGKEFTTGSHSYHFKMQYICDNCMARLQRQIDVMLICMIILMMSFILGILIIPVGIIPWYYTVWLICSVITLKRVHLLEDEYNKVRYK